MPFHRLTVPTYAGGLPGGYDYLNNAISGTPAFADAAKVGGPNAGTYFIAFGEDATSIDGNRPNKALGENSDYIDNLLRADLAVQARTTVATAVGTVTTIVVAGAGQFFGESDVSPTTDGIATYCQLADDLGETIFSGGDPCLITGFTGATNGSGFSASASITYNISPGVPNGQKYQLRYSVRGNLATLPPDQFANFALRKYRSSSLAFTGGVSWATGGTHPDTTVQAELNKIVSDLGGSSGAAFVGATSGTVQSTMNATNVGVASLISTLTGTGGSEYVGTADLVQTWENGNTLTGVGHIYDQISLVVQQLAHSASGDQGADRVGAYGPPIVTNAPWALTTGSIAGQLQSLLGFVNAPFKVRTWSTSGAIDSGGIRDAICVLGATAIAIILPNAATNFGRLLVFIDPTGLLSPTAAANLTSAGGLINDRSGVYALVTPYGRWLAVSDGTNWHTFNG